MRLLLKLLVIVNYKILIYFLMCFFYVYVVYMNDVG